MRIRPAFLGGVLLAAPLAAPAAPAPIPASSSPVKTPVPPTGAAEAAQTGPYDARADAAADLKAAGARAASSGHRVLAVVGGNWCGWCRALHRLMTTDEAVRSALAASFEVVHVNYSKENRNEAVMKRLGRPDLLGFPALVVLSPSLDVLVKQETGSLEKADKSVAHESRKLLELLTRWRGR